MHRDNGGIPANVFTMNLADRIKLAKGIRKLPPAAYTMSGGAPLYSPSPALLCPDATPHVARCSHMASCPPACIVHSHAPDRLRCLHAAADRKGFARQLDKAIRRPSSTSDIKVNTEDDGKEPQKKAAFPPTYEDPSVPPAFMRQSQQAQVSKKVGRRHCVVREQGCLMITLVVSPHSVYIMLDQNSYRPCGYVAREDCKNHEACPSLACTGLVPQ